MTGRVRWHRTTVAVAVVVAVLIAVAVAMVGWARGGRTQPGPSRPGVTGPPPPTVTAPAATASTLTAPGSSTRDPEVFTTGTLPGPIQVRVPTTPPCTPGVGYQVRYVIANNGPPARGPVTAQLDLQPPIQVTAALTLARGEQLDASVLVPGTGELVTVTWQARTSFPIEVEPCPPAAADERQAGRVTTTT